MASLVPMLVPDGEMGKMPEIEMMELKKAISGNEMSNHNDIASM